jgi:two-component system chemotaxis sensor kinase CheA
MLPIEIDRNYIAEIFRAEAEENLRAMEEAFVVLESTPGDAETLKAVFRAAHTLKGSAAGLGFTSLSRFAHTVEDVLDRLRTGTSVLTTPLATLLLRTVDSLRRLVKDSLEGLDALGSEDVDLLVALNLEAAGASKGNELEKIPAPPQHAGPAPQAKTVVPAKPTASILPPPVQDRRSGVGRRGADQAPAPEKRSVRVGLDKLDRLMTMTGEIAIARARLSEALGRTGRAPSLEEAVEVHRNLDRMFIDLQEEVMRARMIPLGPTMRQFARTVRDAATACRKLVDFEIDGDDIEVDMNVVDHLRDPLTHIIRNAVDHGIESPDLRQALGKQERGRIQMQVRREAGFIVIEVQDDGTGLDRRRLISRALTLGYGPDIEHFDDRDLFRLILEPGFSTAEQVTEISGRGVGMDVVHRNVEALRGSIVIDSRLGTGTTFTIRVPLTLSVMRGLSVAAEGQTYIVPLDHVVECIEFPPTQTAGARGVLEVRGQALPYVRLRDVLLLGNSHPPAESVLVLEHGGQYVGLVVDALMAESQVVIRPLSHLLGDVPCVSGSTIGRDGQVALILEVDGLIREVLGRDRTTGAAVTH